MSSISQLVNAGPDGVTVQIIDRIGLLAAGNKLKADEKMEFIFEQGDRLLVEGKEYPWNEEGIVTSRDQILGYKRFEVHILPLGDGVTFQVPVISFSRAEERGLSFLDGPYVTTAEAQQELWEAQAHFPDDLLCLVGDPSGYEIWGEPRGEGA